jgi:polyisoprenyl-teichoic acid--peptidoglycan teichoic acid transferase
MASDAIPSRHAQQPQSRGEATSATRATRGRGRHASGKGDGLGRLLTWTTIGAIVPGAGFLAAGRRWLGGFFLALVVLGVAGVAGLYLTGHLTNLGFKLAVRPNALLALAVIAVVGGLIWAAVIIGEHKSLRRFPLRMSQNVLSVLLVAALVAAVLVPAGTVARYALAQRSVVLNVFDEQPGVPVDPDQAAPDLQAKDPWADTPRINVLLIGSDAGVDRTGTRPDTLIVASIDTQTGDTVLFSLPRNLQDVPFPPGTPGAKAWPRGFNCGDQCLINAVWEWAEQNSNLFPGDPEPGLTATRQVVSEVLGLNLDYYALVNLQGFVDLVDAMGGIQINVERRIPIGITGHRPTGWVEPGDRVLNGNDALWYARSRADSTDYERMRRQRCVIGAAIDQADPVSLALAFPRLAASAQRNVETSIRGSELDAFVELAQRVKRGTIRSLPFTDQVIMPSHPDFDAIRAAVQDALEPPPAATGTPSASAPSSAAPTQPGSTATAPAPNPDQAQNIDAVCG